MEESLRWSRGCGTNRRIADGVCLRAPNHPPWRLAGARAPEVGEAIPLKLTVCHSSAPSSLVPGPRSAGLSFPIWLRSGARLPLGKPKLVNGSSTKMQGFVVPPMCLWYGLLQQSWPAERSRGPWLGS
jgi:hypothetical protein